MQYHDITTDEQLQAYCQELARAKTIAFDTEFVSEHTYQPVLCLIQVAADGQLAVIDTITVADITPFWEVLAGPGHQTIVHAGRGEVEFCIRAIGRPPAQLIDVQLAAALAGAEYPAGLSTLIAKFLGTMPPKHETRTDWRRRPLSKRQVEYALNDARYLQPLHDTIHAKLDELGRLGWLDDEMAIWQETIEQAMSHNRWRRVSGNSGLDARTLAIIRELYHWRDAEAQRRDQPVRRILRDDLIVELAKRGSADLHRISALRGLERGDLKRQLVDIAAAIQRGLDVPDEECPPRAPREQTPELSVLGQFLFAALGNICREAQLSPSLVGTPNDIRDWIAYHMTRGRGKSRAVPKLARGWRAGFVGRMFEDVLDGKLSIRVADPKSDHPLAFEGMER